MSIRQFGTFTVVNRPVATGVFVQAGDTLTINSNGMLHFGGTGGWHGNSDANGVDWWLPNESSVPSLRYKSLIWTSGRTWRQGGTSTGPMTINESGEVVLACNERAVEDNSGGWQITIDRETATDTELPRPSSSSALCQSLSGDFELVITKNQHQSDSGVNSGDVSAFRRSSSRSDFGTWYWRRHITQGGGFSNPNRVIPVDSAFRLPSLFQATDGQFWGVCVQGRRQGGQVKYFGLSRDWGLLGGGERDVQGASNCIGSPAMTQSGFGPMSSNFELIVPVAGGGMDHYWLNRNTPHNEFNAGWNRFTHFGRPGIEVEAVRLMYSTFGNLEVLALERGPNGRELVAYWQNGSGGNWHLASVIPGSTGRVSGIPAFIQSSWGAEESSLGTFEVVVPATNGGLLYFTRHAFAWRENDPIPSSTRFAAAHMIQSTFRSDGVNGNFEVVAETGNNLRFGFGQLFFCFFNTATRSWSTIGRIPV
jgi:hypothetical protein